MKRVTCDAVVAGWYEAAVAPENLRGALELTWRFFGASRVRFLRMDSGSGRLQDDFAAGPVDERENDVWPWDVDDTFLGQHGSHVLGGAVAERDGSKVWLRLVREPDQQPFDEEGVRRLQRLVSRIKGAVLLWMKSSAADRGGRLGQCICDSLGLGLVVVDREGRLQFTNEAAKRCLRSAGGVLERNGSIAMVEKSAQARLHASLAVVGRQVCAGGGVEILCAETGDGDRLLISVSPLPIDDHSDAQDERGLVLLTISEQQTVRQGDPKVLMKLFGLSRKEADLAHALLVGWKLDEYAASTHVGYGTVRSQLHAVFSKIGVKRQAELIHLLARVLEVSNINLTPHVALNRV